MNSAKLLAHTSLAAGVVFTATAEYSLARRLGAHEAVAVMLPVAIDAYAIAALKRFRAFDIALSLMLMGAAQVSAHLLDSHVMPVNGWLVVVVSLLVPTAIWRTHALARDEDDVPAEPIKADVIRSDSAPTVERVPEAYPVLETAVPAVPEGDSPSTRIRADLPAVETAVLAAEEPRTRPEVRAEYVPEEVWESDHAYLMGGDQADEQDNPAEPAPLGIDQSELNEAALLFKDELLAGKIPGIARIKAECRVGQDKAKEIQEGFRQAQVAWRLAGSGAQS